MARIARSATEKQLDLPPCTVCGAPGPLAFWLEQLCEPCHVRYLTERPPDSALELAHADAHPEDVEIRGNRTYVAAGEDPRFVLLKPGVSARVLEQHARAWVSKARKPRAA
jgi:hypothetical protein